MSPSQPLAVAASYPAQNSHRSRGHLIVLPGRGEDASLYQRFGSRLSYDGYTVTVVRLPALQDLDGDWLERVVLWDAANEAGPITFVGSDSGAYLAAYLAGRLGSSSAVLAGIGGTEFAADPGYDDERAASRSSCPVHRGKLADGGADLAALSRQRFAPQTAGLLTAARLTIPTLVIHGENDPITPLHSALPTYRALAPEAEVVTVVGGVHDSLNDITHRSVAAEIVQFLEKRDKPILNRLVPAAVSEAA